MDNNNFFETKDVTGSFDTKDIEQNKVVSVIGYIPVLFLVPLLGASNSPFAKFHANQGLILTLASIVLGIARSVICTIISFIPFVGGIISGVISVVVSLVILALMVLGIVNTSQGKAKELPFIGGLFTIIQ